jgi:hypothetical protein
MAEALTPWQLAHALHNRAFRQPIDLRAAEEMLRRCFGRHGLPVFRRAMELHLAGCVGTRSWNEDRFLALVITAGIVEPLVNTRIRIRGVIIEPDLRWEEHGIVVEIDDSNHDRPYSRIKDLDNDELLRGAGYEVIRVRPHAFRSVVRALKERLPQAA